MEKNDNDQNESMINHIIDNYVDLERSIVNQLKLSNKLHPTTTGTCREDIWLELFERIIPKKFVLEHSIFIIDSKGHISKEVDLAIIDNSYTPYIFQYGRLKYVPIEAVAAVAECKSTSLFFREADKEKDIKDGGMTAWCKSIESLRTFRKSVARMANGTVVDGISYGSHPNMTSTQTSTRPIRIFCGYETKLTEDQKNNLYNFFDFELMANVQKEAPYKEKIEITTDCKKDLQEWYN